LQISKSEFWARRKGKKYGTDPGDGRVLEKSPLVRRIQPGARIIEQEGYRQSVLNVSSDGRMKKSLISRAENNEPSISERLIIKKNLGLLTANIIIAIGIAAGTVNTANGADAGVKGKPPYVWSHIENLADVEAIKPGDSIAMACPKCKTITMTLVTQDTKTKSKLIPGKKHLCPGCNSTITVVGSKAHNEQVIKHVCKVCGDESAFCCITKPGGSATKGMEKK
jgi:hypothetical protein